MTESVVTKQCPAAISDDVKSYWQAKLPRIERLLGGIPEEQRQLRLNFECDQSPYEAWAVLTLPTGTLVARSDPIYHNAHEAIDQVADRLATEIRRHKEFVFREYHYHRKERRRRDLTALEPRLSALRRKGDRKPFEELLRLHLQQIGDEARRELIMAQLEGRVRPGELTVDELLEETIARAWDDWHRRPRDQPLDLWLIGLLHDVLDEKNAAAQGDRGQTAGTPGADSDRPSAAEHEWALEDNPYWPFVDPLARDDVLPDEKTVGPSPELADDETRGLILSELRRFPREQRRAFTLHALDAWTIEEVARRQGRSPDEVRADIESVRAALRQRLTQGTAA